MANSGVFSIFFRLLTGGVLVGLLMSASKANADDVSYRLSLRLLSAIENNPQSAADRYLRELYELSPSGIVTQEVLNAGILFERSRARASFMAGVLRYDLDGSFDVSEEEVEAANEARDAISEIMEVSYTHGSAFFKEVGEVIAPHSAAKH